MTKRCKSPPVSKTDLRILSVLWRKGQATGREIYDSLVASGDLSPDVAYTTVKTYADRLVQKGYADAEILDDPPGVYRYKAMVARDELLNRPDVVEEVIDSLQMNAPSMVRWFSARRKITPDELHELKKIVDEESSS